MQCWLRFLFLISIPVVLGDALRGILYLPSNCAYFGGKNNDNDNNDNNFKVASVMSIGLLCTIKEFVDLFN